MSTPPGRRSTFAFLPVLLAARRSRTGFGFVGRTVDGRAVARPLCAGATGSTGDRRGARAVIPGGGGFHGRGLDHRTTGGLLGLCPWRRRAELGDFLGLFDHLHLSGLALVLYPVCQPELAEGPAVVGQPVAQDRQREERSTQ